MVIVAIVVTRLSRSRPVCIVSPWLHVWRGLLTFAIWYGVVKVVGTLPLPLAQTLLYADALLAPIAFRLVTGDRLDRTVLSLTVCGFVGVLIACIPSVSAAKSAGSIVSWFVALGAAAALSLSLAIGRKIAASAGGHDQLGPMLLTSATLVAVLGCSAATVDMARISNRPTPFDAAWWRAIGLDGLVWLVASSVTSTLAIGLLTAGANLGGSSATMFGLLGLPISYGIAWV